ncbi:hypothetical protein GQ43DRAFT_215502 [Delitschia confertaspora ATCC 74209]|uniref:Uncharacterized protein n=1 Tax=Delitschia confertaspora ATCC 74209 TaxID=1513339 RepID=A0A9P4JD71_9PLEO|nr:hypothetical protein GQ43DRAFT_215502 [Delitschia confertaspora ATCC 74209]
MWQCCSRETAHGACLGLRNTTPSLVLGSALVCRAISHIQKYSRLLSSVARNSFKICLSTPLSSLATNTSNQLLQHKLSPYLNSLTMGLMWTKQFGGRRAGGGVVVDKHGVRRAPFRFSLGRFSCFR